MSNRQIIVSHQRQSNFYSIVADDGSVTIQHRFTAGELKDAAAAFDFYVDDFSVPLDAEFVEDVRHAFLAVAKNVANHQLDTPARGRENPEARSIVHRFFSPANKAA